MHLPKGESHLEVTSINKLTSRKNEGSTCR